MDLQDHLDESTKTGHNIQIAAPEVIKASVCSWHSGL